jgi:hypothetical protein
MPETRMTPEDVHDELMDFKVEIHKEFGDFKAEIYKMLGDFKADLLKTIWLTQLSTIGIVLVGVGLLIHFKL